MTIQTSPASIIYAENGWAVRVTQSGSEITFSVESLLTGDYEFSSGTNLEHLATLILAAKADAIGRGINWSNN